MNANLGLENRCYKIIFVCHEFPPIGGGAATALENLSKNLANIGHNVTVLTIGHSGAPITHTEKLNLTIVSLGNIRKNSFCPSILEFITSYFLLKFKAPLYIDSLNPDVVISFFAFPAGRAIWHHLYKHNIPHIVSIRGADAPGFYEERWGRIAQHLVPYLIKPVLYTASAIYANGKRLKNLVEAHFEDINVSNIPNGVTLDAPPEFNKRSFLTYKLIFVGQLIERKRAKETLEGVILFARNTSKRIDFTIVGTGALETELRKIADAIPPNLSVYFKGYMSRKDLSDLYNQQHVMIHLSQDEGVSNTLLEAFAKGLAVLASESVVYELSEDIQFPGTVLKSFTPRIISNSIADIFLNIETLNQNFYKSINIAKEFSWEKNTEKFLDLLERVLKIKRCV